MAHAQNHPCLHWGKEHASVTKESGGMHLQGAGGMNTVQPTVLKKEKLRGRRCSSVLAQLAQARGSILSPAEVAIAAHKCSSST